MLQRLHLLPEGIERVGVKCRRLDLHPQRGCLRLLGLRESPLLDAPPEFGQRSAGTLQPGSRRGRLLLPHQQLSAFRIERPAPRLDGALGLRHERRLPPCVALEGADFLRLRPVPLALSRYFGVVGALEPLAPLLAKTAAAQGALHALAVVVVEQVQLAARLLALVLEADVIRLQGLRLGDERPVPLSVRLHLRKALIQRLRLRVQLRQPLPNVRQRCRARAHLVQFPLEARRLRLEPRLLSRHPAFKRRTLGFESMDERCLGAEPIVPGARIL